MRRAPLAVLATLVMAIQVLILSGCFSSFIAPDSAARPDQDVATINNRWGCPFCVQTIRRSEDGALVYEARRDGREVNPLKLAPGPHHISVAWWNVFAGKGASLESTLNLQAGHTYTVHLTTRMFAPYKMWITDDTDGRVLDQNWRE
jgi:hypothetical protein